MKIILLANVLKLRRDDEEIYFFSGISENSVRIDTGKTRCSCFLTLSMFTFLFPFFRYKSV